MSKQPVRPVGRHCFAFFYTYFFLVEVSTNHSESERERERRDEDKWNVIWTRTSRLAPEFVCLIIRQQRWLEILISDRDFRWHEHIYHKMGLFVHLFVWLALHAGAKAKASLDKICRITHLHGSSLEKRQREWDRDGERERPHTCWFLTLCAFASLESYTTLFSIVCPDWARHCPQWQLRSLAAAAASSSLPACAISIRICALFSHLREASFCFSDGSSRWCGNSAPCATPTASGNDP